MDPMKPTGVARVWRSLRDLAQWMIEFCGPWDGSPRVKFGSPKSVGAIGVVAALFLGIVILNVIQDREILSWDAFGTIACFVLITFYALRTPAKDRPRSNVPQQ